MKTWVEISKSALLHNVRAFKKLVSPSRVIPVVKANAYGHGILEISKILQTSKLVTGLAVVNSGEAFFLRENGIKIPLWILSYFEENEAQKLIGKNVSFPVYNQETVSLLSKISKGKPVNIHVKVDCGTHRLGATLDTFDALLEQISKHKNLHLRGIFAHYSSSEEDFAYTKYQTNLFKKFQEKLSQKFSPEHIHIACTAASCVLPESRGTDVRFGIGLYGLWPSEQVRKKMSSRLTLKPVLSWKTKIIQIKEIPKGDFVGYGNTFRAKRKTRLAVLPVGYYEGYDRGLSNCGEVLIRGQKCPVIGRVCMNLTMIDVTSAGKTVMVGNEVVLIGKQGQEEITADDFARKLGTINYEVVTRINPSIFRLITL